MSGPLPRRACLSKRRRKSPVSARRLGVSSCGLPTMTMSIPGEYRRRCREGGSISGRTCVWPIQRCVFDGILHGEDVSLAVVEFLQGPVEGGRLSRARRTRDENEAEGGREGVAEGVEAVADEAHVGETQVRPGRVEKTHHRPLPQRGRQYRDTDVDLPPPQVDVEAPVLGEPPFGDVEARVRNADHRRMQAREVAALERTRDAEAHARLPRRLDVNVARPGRASLRSRYKTHRRGRVGVPAGRLVLPPASSGLAGDEAAPPIVEALTRLHDVASACGGQTPPNNNNITRGPWPRAGRLRRSGLPFKRRGLRGGRTWPAERIWGRRRQGFLHRENVREDQKRRGGDEEEKEEEALEMQIDGELVGRGAGEALSPVSSASDAFEGDAVKYRTPSPIRST